MTRADDISVAVATLNRPAALARCLDSILGGDVLPRELIVVDQGSGTEAEEVVAQRSGSETPIVLVRQARLGLSASRNTAFRRAEGLVVAVTDDDCVPSAEWVAALQDVLGSPSSPFAAVTGPLLPLPAQGARVWPVSSRTEQAQVNFAGFVVPWRVGTGGNFALRREWFARIGPYDERLGAGTEGRAAEDMELLHRLLVAGGRVRYEPRAIVYHERQEASRRRETRSAYGHGIGAYAAIRLRQGDFRGLTVLGRWALFRGRRLARALVRGRGASTWEELLVLGGTARGMAYGARVGAPSNES